MAVLAPRDEADLCEIIRDAAATGGKLELLGGGTRTSFGGPREVMPVSLVALTGVIDYDPAELVLTVRPATPLREIQDLVAGEGQMLAFEPWGDPSSTIGGTVAAGVAGSRRVTAGSARDHLLGFRAVSGRGEPFVAGAKVVKNVTGYDLPKLMAGSWGRIGAMTELTLKVLPAPRETTTLVAEGLSPETAHLAMSCALGSNAEVSAAAHLARGLTLFRIAGFAPSVEARSAALLRHLAEHCAVDKITAAEADPLWREAMTGIGLSGETLWRVQLAPRRAPSLLRSVDADAVEWAMDWGGGRVWVAHPGAETFVRQVAITLGGEAVLVRASDAMRASEPAFQPRAAGLAALEQRVRRAFDPQGVFATTRFAEDTRAN